MVRHVELHLSLYVFGYDDTVITFARRQLKLKSQIKHLFSPHTYTHHISHLASSILMKLKKQDMREGATGGKRERSCTFSLSRRNLFLGPFISVEVPQGGLGAQ